MTESHADASLEALFPTTLGGTDLAVQSLAGEDAVLDPEDRPAVAEALGSLGKTYEDLTGAVAISPAGIILAYRVTGTDASAFLPLIMGVMVPDAELGETQVGGKDVTLVGTDAPFYAYASGDVLWLVQAQEPALTEAIEALP